MDLSFCFICSVCRDNDVAAGNERSYWAKGTGFGTGSTSSGWDVEQAMLKQKAEEEHVTCLLQVPIVERSTREFHTNHLLMLMSRCRQFKLTTAWLSQLVSRQHADWGLWVYVLTRQTLKLRLVVDCKALWVLNIIYMFFTSSQSESAFHFVCDSS